MLTSNKNKCFVSAVALALLAGAKVTLSFQTALADDRVVCTSGASCGTDFGIQDAALQPVPAVFKLQAKISQAKLPVGDARFEQIGVYVKRASGQTLCSETFSNIQVYNSVLNLDIGGRIACSGGQRFSEVIAGHNDLGFQICLGTGDNCLKPVALGTVPAAVKSDFARLAGQAERADLAAQSHYTHRASADAALTSEGPRHGYYDFHTPADASAFAGQSVATAEGGFIRWIPVNPAHRQLHIASGNAANDQTASLSELIVHAESTSVLGHLVAGDSLDVDGPLTVKSDALVSGLLRAEGGLMVSGSASFGNTTFSSSNGDVATIYNGVTTFKRDVRFEGLVTLPPGAMTPPGNSVNSAVVVDGSLTGADLAGGTITTDKLATGLITEDRLSPELRTKLRTCLEGLPLTWQ